MENKTLDVTTLSIAELKVLAYDQIAAFEGAQANLRIINEEIARRNQPAPKEEAVEEKPKKK